MPSGGDCLSQRQASAFSDENCIVVGEFVREMPAERLSLCNQMEVLWGLLYGVASLKIASVGFALNGNDRVYH